MQLCIGNSSIVLSSDTELSSCNYSETEPIAVTIYCYLYIGHVNFRSLERFYCLA